MSQRLPETGDGEEQCKPVNPVTPLRMSHPRNSPTQPWFVLGLLPSAGVFFVYYVALEVGLGAEIDPPTALGAILIFLVCAPLALVSMMLSSRPNSSRWPRRIVLAILTMPLALVLLHFLATVVIPFFSNDG
ncbi:MAG: hypothetical protein H7A46_19305 [Verrucomicrobiales bacterium]|nr:hypothetical protein [Verrucomicrobiales bacterium]